MRIPLEILEIRRKILLGIPTENPWKKKSEVCSRDVSREFPTSNFQEIIEVIPENIRDILEKILQKSLMEFPLNSCKDHGKNTWSLEDIL